VLESPVTFSAEPRAIDAQGEGHEIEIDPASILGARVRLRGRGHRVIIEEGVTLSPFTPAGFSPTVPSLAPPSADTIVIEGENNTLIIRRGAQLRLNMTLRGAGSRAEIGADCKLHGFADLLTSHGRLSLGEGTTMVQGSIQLHEPGAITFGRDCMISSQVYVSLSDIHPIYDRKTGARLNPPASVTVGDHVWVGLRAMILKGANIGNGAVVAAGAIVSGDMPADAIIAGAPARVLREDIVWRRDFSDDLEPGPLPNALPPKKRWRLFRAKS
jgi:acetyltransferase-like isoleucine patch superfamily enzyme